VKIKYIVFNSIPSSTIMTGILDLHENIFGVSEDLISKMTKKPNLLIVTAMNGEKVIGYKIGYEINKDIFYSWLGGVDSNHRKDGIATQLMIKQHQILKENGYRTVQTKTMNKWRGMLLLNIKNGFDVTETYIDDNGLHKIILEKSLND
jgi:predicted GNAT superfamily acetyltransferase